MPADNQIDPRLIDILRRIATALESLANRRPGRVSTPGKDGR